MAAVGTVLPLAAFLPWLLDQGLDVPRFCKELFVNRISSFFGFDVLVSAVVVTMLALLEGRRARTHLLWLPVDATLLVGASPCLPLLPRERALARK